MAQEQDKGSDFLLRDASQLSYIGSMQHRAFMNVHFRLTLWYWRTVELVGVIRRRSDVVIGSALIGLLVAMIFSAAVKPVFSSRAKIHDYGVDADGNITNPPPGQDSNPEWY
jgi:hypothetical protein